MVHTGSDSICDTIVFVDKEDRRTPAAAHFVDAVGYLCENCVDLNAASQGVQYFQVAVHLVISAFALGDIPNVQHQATNSLRAAQIGHGGFNPGLITARCLDVLYEFANASLTVIFDQRGLELAIVINGFQQIR